MVLSKAPRRPRIKSILLYLLLAAALWVLLPTWPTTPEPDVNYGLLQDASSESRVAFATFLSGTPSLTNKNDNYFRSVRLLTYQLLHAPETRSNASIPFLVLVTNEVPTWKREQLERDGATVIEAEDVPLTWWIKTGVKRWKDQFTKLRFLQMTEYSRILFIDADTFITKPLDSIFDEPGVRSPSKTLFEDRHRQIKGDEALLPANYVFAARSDNQFLGERDHKYPPGRTEVFTAGFWVAAPSHELYAYLMSVMSHWRRFNPHTMEQSLLNYAFRRSGAMPWTELDPKWSATWPNMGDFEAGVASLHEKFWRKGPNELKGKYARKRLEAEEFFQEREEKMKKEAA